MKRPAPQKTGLVRRFVRRVVRYALLLVGALVAAIALFAFKAASEAYPNDRRVAVVPKGALAGAYHVHSTLSDGRATPEEIAALARETGLQFVVLTDHNAAPGAPRYENGVLLISATELSTPNGHVVALGLPRELAAEERDGDALAVVEGLGGAAFLSHPVQEKNPWRAWEPLPRVAGLELYSADTMLREALASPFSRLLPAAGAYLTSPTHAIYSLVREQPETAERLLALSVQSPKIALCAADAHGLPAYDEVFRAMAMYVPHEGKLPEDPAAAAAAVVGGLTSGAAYCGFRALGDPVGFQIAGLASRQTASAGSSLRIVPPPRTPDAVELRVTGPGEVRDKWTVLLNAPGAVQIELWRRAPGRFWGSEWKPWIVPSPVRVQ